MAMKKTGHGKPAGVEAAPLPPAPPQALFGASGADLAALTAAGVAFTAGLERIGREWIDLTRESLAYTAATGIALLDAASIADVANLASRYASGVVERSTSGTARMIELGLALAGDVSAPLAGRREGAADERGGRSAS